MVDKADDQEKARLVEGMGEEVGDCGNRCRFPADAQEQHQEPQRSNSRLRQRLLEIGLAQGPGAPPEQRDTAEDRQGRRPDGRAAQQRGEASDQVDAGLHHRR